MTAARYKQTVKTDLQNILSGACKPSQQSVTTLANDLCNALADGTITPQEAVKLSEEVAAVLNSANISQQQAQKLLTDMQTLQKQTNLTKQDAQTIETVVKALVTTAPQNAKSKMPK